MGFKVKDHFYRKAKEEGFAARSVYKLKEMDRKYHLFNRKDKVLDLGYYPGSWAQYAAGKVGQGGLVVGVDLSSSKPNALEGHVSFFQKDVFSLTSLLELNLDTKVNILLSDMAPRMTGIKSVDQARSLQLVEKVFDMMEVFLEKDGKAVIKVFDSGDVHAFLKTRKKMFNRFHYVRPKASRSSSSEFFVIGQGHR